MTKGKWSKKEVRYLKKNLGILSLEEIANHLNRSKKSVSGKIYRDRINYKIHKNNYKSWTEKEEEYLYKYYSKKDISEIARILGRTEASISKKAELLGLSSTDFYLSNNILSYAFSVSPRRIKKWENEYGLPVLRIKRKNTIYYGIDSEDFWKWADKHRDLIPWERYDESLPLEPKFAVIEKQRARKRIEESNKPNIDEYTERKIFREYIVHKVKAKKLAEEYGISESKVRYIIRKEREKIKAKETQ